MIPAEWNKHKTENTILGLETKKQINFLKHPENSCNST